MKGPSTPDKKSVKVPPAEESQLGASQLDASQLGASQLGASQSTKELSQSELRLQRSSNRIAALRKSLSERDFEGNDADRQEQLESLKRRNEHLTRKVEHLEHKIQLQDLDLKNRDTEIRSLKENVEQYIRELEAREADDLIRLRSPEPNSGDSRSRMSGSTSPSPANLSSLQYVPREGDDPLPDQHDTSDDISNDTDDALSQFAAKKKLAEQRRKNMNDENNVLRDHVAEYTAHLQHERELREAMKIGVAEVQTEEDAELVRLQEQLNEARDVASSSSSKEESALAEVERLNDELTRAKADTVTRQFHDSTVAATKNANSALMNQIRGLEHDLQQATRDAAKAKNQVDTLSRKSNDLSAELAEKDRTIQKMTKLKEELESKTESAKQDAKVELEQELKQAVATTAEKEEALQKSEEKVQKLEDEAEQLRDKEQKIKDTEKETAEQVAKAKESSADMQRQASDLNEQLQAQTQRSNALREQLTAAEKAYADEKNISDTLREQLAAETKDGGQDEVEHAEKQAKQAAATTAEKEEALQKSEEKVQKLEDEAEQLRDELQKVKDAQRENAGQEAEKQKSTAERQRQTSDLNEQLQTQAETLSALRDQVATREEASAAKEKELSAEAESLRQQLADVQKGSSGQNEVTSLGEQLATAEKAAADEKSTNEKLREQLTAAVENRDKAQVEQAEAQAKQATEKEQALQKSEDKVHELERSLENSKSNESKTKSEADNLASKLNDALSQVKNKDSELVDKESQLKKKTDENTELINQIKTLSKELDVSKGANDKLKTGQGRLLEALSSHPDYDKIKQELEKECGSSLTSGPLEYILPKRARQTISDMPGKLGKASTSFVEALRRSPGNASASVNKYVQDCSRSIASASRQQRDQLSSLDAMTALKMVQSHLNEDGHFIPLMGLGIASSALVFITNGTMVNR